MIKYFGKYRDYVKYVMSYENKAYVTYFRTRFSPEK